MKTFKEAARKAFYIFIAIYSVMLLIGGITNIVYAQSHDYRFESLEKRISDLEELKLDQRVTRIETILINLEMEHTNWLNYAGNGGVGLLLIRALYFDIKKRRGID